MRTVKLIVVSIGILALAGCSSERFDRNVPRGTAVASPASFSDETYVWEGFLFPTNRTTGR